MDSALLVRMLRMTNDRECVEVRFSKDCMVGLIRLSRLIENDPRVKLENEQAKTMLLMTIGSGTTKNFPRTYKVRGLFGVELGTLHDLCRDIEQIELVHDHRAKGLMIKRVKSRDEAVNRIISEVLTDDFVSEIESWGFTISGHFTEDLGLPALQFQICMPSGEMILRATINGWTGRFGHDGGTNAGRYYDPGIFQEYLREHFERRLEILTAA